MAYKDCVVLLKNPAESLILDPRSRKNSCYLADDVLCCFVYLFLFESFSDFDGIAWFLA